MNTTPFALIIWMMIGSAIHCDELPKWDQLDDEILERLQHPMAKDVDQSWLTHEKREIVIERLLRREAEYVSQGEKPVDAVKGLARLGHEPTIRRIAEELRKPTAFDSPLSEAPEVAIPYIMPLVYTTPAVDPNDYSIVSDVRYMPVLERVLSLVLSRITSSRNFPLETRQWARDMLSDGIRYRDEAYVDLIKIWWEHNQTAILEKRYAQATWLPSYKGKLAVHDHKKTETPSVIPISIGLWAALVALILIVVAFFFGGMRRRRSN